MSFLKCLHGQLWALPSKSIPEQDVKPSENPQTLKLHLHRKSSAFNVFNHEQAQEADRLAPHCPSDHRLE